MTKKKVTENVAQHTPGPWRAHLDDGFWVQPPLASEPVICDLVPRDADVFTDEDEANAHLIAAAPDLLAAARLALAEMVTTVAPRDSFTDAVDALDAAISKAEGR